MGTAAAKEYDYDSTEGSEYEAHVLKIWTKIGIWTYYALAAVAFPGTGAHERATHQAQQARKQKEI